MGPRENVACRWFAEVWNRKDADAIHRLGTPDMIAHGPDGSHRSPADFAAFHKRENDRFAKVIKDASIETE